MKQFDPTTGWIPQTPQAVGPTGDQPPLPHPSSVYHFGRQGNRLNVTHVDEGLTPHSPSEPSPAAPSLRDPSIQPEAPPKPASAETAGMVCELFERLDEADPSRHLLARVTDQLKTLNDLAIKRGQLERVLEDIREEIEQINVQMRVDLEAACENEDRNLKLGQYRRELLNQLARRLPTDH